MVVDTRAAIAKRVGRTVCFDCAKALRRAAKGAGVAVVVGTIGVVDAEFANPRLAHPAAEALRAVGQALVVVFASERVQR
jgi:hypothetical protein